MRITSAMVAVPGAGMERTRLGCTPPTRSSTLSIVAKAGGSATARRMFAPRLVADRRIISGRGAGDNLNPPLVDGPAEPGLELDQVAGHLEHVLVRVPDRVGAGAADQRHARPEPDEGAGQAVVAQVDDVR